MTTIDADAHVLETPETWRYLREDEQGYTPMVVSRTSGAQEHGLEGQAVEEYWVIDGSILPKEDNVGSDTTVDTREMRDIPARLAHMDRLEVDIQVLYPTLFLRPITMKAGVELALSRSYNRWLADIWRQAPERLRWVMSPPLLAMDKLDEELDFAQDNGAVGIFMRGLEMRPHAQRSPFLPGLRGGRAAEPADLHPFRDQQPDHAPLLPRRFRLQQVQARDHRGLPHPDLSRDPRPLPRRPLGLHRGVEPVGALRSSTTSRTASRGRARRSAKTCSGATTSGSPAR